MMGKYTKDYISGQVQPSTEDFADTAIRGLAGAIMWFRELFAEERVESEESKKGRRARAIIARLKNYKSADSASFDLSAIGLNSEVDTVEALTALKKDLATFNMWSKRLVKSAAPLFTALHNYNQGSTDHPEQEIANAIKHISIPARPKLTGLRSGISVTVDNGKVHANLPPVVHGITAVSYDEVRLVGDLLDDIYWITVFDDDGASSVHGVEDWIGSFKLDTRLKDYLESDDKMAKELAPSLNALMGELALFKEVDRHLLIAYWDRLIKSLDDTAKIMGIEL